MITKSLPIFDTADSISAVDRILKQQKAEREAAAEALAKEKVDKTALVSPPPIPSKPEPTPTRTLPIPPVPVPAPTPALTPAPISTRPSTPGTEHSGDTDTDRSSITSRPDSLVDIDSKGRSKQSLIDNFRQKMYSKPQPPTFSDKGPQVHDKPITDLVTPLTNIGGLPPWPLGLAS